MAKRKLELTITSEQLDVLYQTLKAGAPLQLALQRVGISMATYYYWVAISSIVVYVKSQEEIEELEELAKSGVSIQNIRDIASAQTKAKKTGIGEYIEPTQAGILQYKNSRKFRKFADQVHAIVSECDRCRADFATVALSKIARSTDKKNGINPSGAMWWLERNMPEQFAKASEKSKESETAADLDVPSIEVEFIDPATHNSTQRLVDMEAQILNDMKGSGAA